MDEERVTEAGDGDSAGECAFVVYLMLRPDNKRQETGWV